MISPAELFTKAQKKYPELLKATLTGQELFPLTIRADLSLTKTELSKAAKQVQALAKHSKNHLGYGFSLEWEQRNSRSFGNNEFPSKVYFQTRNDFLKYINKRDDFILFEQTCNLIKSEFPLLSGWLEKNVSLVQKVVIPNVAELLTICHYLIEHPKPGCFVRELPIMVQTKFIERNETLLRQWLDLILPASSIQSHEEDFYIRFGLRRSRSHFLIRVLDNSISDELGINFEEFSLPFEAMQELRLQNVTVYIIENRTNLLTFPKISSSLALGGLGNGVLEFKYFSWLHDCKIYYWGDLDVEGFEILSRLRKFFGHTKSIFMNPATFNKYKHLATKGNGRQITIPSNLFREEQEVLSCCQNENLRLEQEKISQQYVNSILTTG